MTAGQDNSPVDELEQDMEMAETRYDVDYLGIIINGIMNGVTAGFSAFIARDLGGISMETAALLFGVILITNTMPKITSEVRRAQAIKSAQKDAYLAGRRSRKGSVAFIMDTFARASFN